mmetsp:Transcript_30061/g.75319  ORF Transcript_30061/g.75319 Transcript_30061/m.75319 type:complete len:268 (+) Transcript_30061:1197-2000(+)
MAVLLFVRVPMGPRQVGCSDRRDSAAPSAPEPGGGSNRHINRFGTSNVSKLSSSGAGFVAPGGVGQGLGTLTVAPNFPPRIASRSCTCVGVTRTGDAVQGKVAVGSSSAARPAPSRSSSPSVASLMKALPLLCTTTREMAPGPSAASNSVMIFVGVLTEGGSCLRYAAWESSIPALATSFSIFDGHALVSPTAILSGHPSTARSVRVKRARSDSSGPTAAAVHAPAVPISPTPRRGGFPADPISLTPRCSGFTTFSDAARAGVAPRT